MPEPVPMEFLEKRRILYGKGMEKRRTAAAAALVAQGRLADALEYLERNRDPALLERVRREAVTAGDAFSLSRACQLLKTAADASEWRELARYAEGKERWFDVVNSLERAGDVEKSEEVRALRCPGFQLFRPAGK